MNTSDFKTARRWNALNRFFQVVLSITLVVGLNVLASQSGVRLRRSLPFAKATALSLETAKQLESAARRAPANAAPNAPWVVIYDTLGATETEKDDTSAAMLAASTRTLLDDFQFAAATGKHNGWLAIERTDNLHRANIFADLQKRLPDISSRTAIVVECKALGRFKIINLEDLRARTRGGATGAWNAGLFRGEDALMSAILRVTDERPRILYHTIGHREMSPDDTGAHGLSNLELRLRSRNIEMRPLDLTKFNAVPADADLVLLAAPQSEFTKSETEKLLLHMRRSSARPRLIVFMDVGFTPRLEELLDDWGILSDDVRIWDPTAADSRGVTIAKRLLPDHDLTRAIATRGHSGTGASGSLAYLQARPARRDPLAPPDETLRVTELFTTSANTEKTILAWGERHYRQPPFRYEPLRGDIEAPVALGAVAERRIGRDLGLKATADGRILVLGSADFASNALLAAGDNEFFLLNAVNWLLDREEMLNIPPRPLAKFQLRATDADLERVTWRFALLPIAAFLLGFLITFWRKHT
jgi:hypothetical protein